MRCTKKAPGLRDEATWQRLNSRCAHGLHGAFSAQPKAMSRLARKIRTLPKLQSHSSYWSRRADSPPISLGSTLILSGRIEVLSQALAERLKMWARLAILDKSLFEETVRLFVVVQERRNYRHRQGRRPVRRYRLQTPQSSSRLKVKAPDERPIRP